MRCGAKLRHETLRITTLCPGCFRAWFPCCTMSRHPATAYGSHPTAPLYTVDELANRLRVDRATVYRLALPFVVVGARRRYRLEDVEAYLAARREEPAR